MKTDSIFYSLFQSFPSIFFELINRSPEEAANYEFTSCEVKQLAFRIDGLFLPKINETDKAFYLVEAPFSIGRLKPQLHKQNLPTQVSKPLICLQSAEADFGFIAANSIRQGWL